ncbi:MAG: hypothetical protein J3K34DRAFT_453765 [Monoraphidium minutum]|nr:MAG: hypothetical protein J3K34DRAFT_453765 [Monoraphidium minutum]
MRQYYVGVSTSEDKLTTLVELLQALQADGSGAALAVAVACGARDSLDQVVAALAACGTFALAVLHADLSMSEIERQVAQLKERAQAQAQQQEERQEQQPEGAAGALEPQAPGGPGAQQDGQRRRQQQVEAAESVGAGGGGGGEGEGRAAAACPSGRASLVLATTDVCLKALPKELLPIGLPLLIQYDIPTSKDAFTRRVSSVFGGSKERRRAQRCVVIDFVVAGELPAFRARERFSTAPVLEMPVHVPDIL